MIAVAFSTAATFLAVAGANPLDTWHLRRQLTGASRVVYGNGRFVVAALEAAPVQLLVSTNGADWKGYLPPEMGVFAGLEFVNGTFILLLSRMETTEHGHALYSSTDGIRWELRRFRENNSYAGNPISCIGGGNGFFVMATSDLSISEDLVSWRSSFLSATGLRQFASGKGVIIGTPFRGRGFVITSGGEVWEYMDPPGGIAYYNIAFANERFAVFNSGAESDGVPTVAVSLDGLEWSHNRLPDFTNSTQLASANEQFFLLRGDAFCSSRDAVNWAKHSFGTNVALIDMAFGGNCYVAVGNAILQSSPVENRTPVAAELAVRNLPGLTITGPIGQTYQIEASDNLAQTNSWYPLTNIVTLSNPFLWVDTTLTNAKPRFYRAVTRPNLD
jgi:hypothetical protein